MRKLILFLIICSTMLTFTSCTGSYELDDLLHITMIGIDRGVSDKWRITVNYATLKEGSGGTGGAGGQKGGGQEEAYASLTVDAPTLFTGIDIINSSISRKLNFMHVDTIVISEDLAKSGLLGEFFSPAVRFREIRRSTHVIVAQGSAMEYIETTQPAVGTALSKNNQIRMKEFGETGFFPDVTLENFYDAMKSTYCQPVLTYAAVSNPESFKQEGEKWGNKFKTGGEYYAGELPINSKVKGRTEHFGTAVFDGDKMVGKLNGDETRLLLIASGKFKRGSFTMQDPKEPKLIVPFDVRQAKKPKVTIDYEGDKPIIHLKAELEGDILAVQSRIDYEQPELITVLEKAFEKQIKEDMDKLMKKVKGLKTDIFGFGRFAARQFLTIQEWEEYNWLGKFQEAKITTEVKFTIRRTGTMLKSSPIISTEGKE